MPAIILAAGKFIRTARDQGLVVEVKKWTVPEVLLESTGDVMLPPHDLVRVTVTLPPRTWRSASRNRSYTGNDAKRLICVWGCFDAPGCDSHWVSGSWWAGKRVTVVNDEGHAGYYLGFLGHLLAQRSR